MRKNIPIEMALFLCAGFMVGCAADKGSEAPSGPEDVPLAAHWSMEDTSGRTVKDATGHGHDGSIIGVPALAAGVSGKALSISGNGAGIDVPDDSAFESQDGFTLSMSFRMESFPAGQGFLFFRGDSRAGLDPIQLTVHSADSSLRFSITGGPTGLTGDSLVSVSASVQTGKWYRVDAVFDTTGGNSVALYVDGALAGKKPTSIFPLEKLEAGQNPGIGIGHHAKRTVNDYAFKGLIDEVRFFSGALSAKKIEAGNY